MIHDAIYLYQLLSSLALSSLGVPSSTVMFITVQKVNSDTVVVNIRLHSLKILVGGGGVEGGS